MMIIKRKYKIKRINNKLINRIKRLKMIKIINRI